MKNLLEKEELLIPTTNEIKRKELVNVLANLIKKYAEIKGDKEDE